MMKIIPATSQLEVPAGGQACSMIRFTDDKACRQLSTLKDLQQLSLLMI